MVMVLLSLISRSAQLSIGTTIVQDTFEQVLMVYVISHFRVQFI